MSSPINFFLETFYLDRVARLFKDTFNQWNEDKAPQLGAALAYYTVFSLAPLTLVLLAVFSLIFGGSQEAHAKITQQMKYFIDPSAVQVIEQILDKASKTSSGVVATVVGVVIALFGASGVFGALQDALNTIWGVKPKPGLGIRGFLKARFLSFGMVGGVCFLLLVSMAFSTIVAGLGSYLDHILPGGRALPLAINLVLDVVVITTMFALIFRFLPDAKIAWRDVWVGAGMTTALFLVGKWALGLYLASGGAGSAYGAASALITTLLWVYYSAQILLFGAEFTQVYANTYGSHVEPEPHAMRVERREVALPTEG